MSSVPMVSPDGRIGDVPQQGVAGAVKAGFKLGAEMVAPNGQPGVLPVDRVHDAIRAGFQLAPSSAGTFAAASVPKPPNSLQGVAGYDALGPVPNDFGTRVGARIQQNVEAISGLPAEAAREVRQAATSLHSASAAISNTANAVYGMLQRTWADWHDPAKVAGDVVTSIIGGAATEGASPTASSVSTATRPAELSLIPKLTKAYDNLQAIGGGAHAPELTPVLDGLNELSQGVIQRIEQAKTGATPATAPSNTLSSLLQGAPKLVRSFGDVQEDAAIQQEMQTNLEQQGAAAYAEQAREFAARNSMDVPKWQRVVNQKVQMLLDQAEQKQTTSPAVKPYKAKAAAAAAGGGDDLTDILKASLDLARKKKGIK